MSRHCIPSDHGYTRFTHGSDHVLGAFLDITDSRYAGTEDDLQGEGYLFEWSSLFGITTNLIEATIEDLEHSQERMQELVDKYCESLKNSIK